MSSLRFEVVLLFSSNDLPSKQQYSHSFASIYVVYIYVCISTISTFLSSLMFMHFNLAFRSPSRKSK